MTIVKIAILALIDLVAFVITRRWLRGRGKVLLLMPLLLLSGDSTPILTSLHAQPVGAVVYNGSPDVFSHQSYLDNGQALNAITGTPGKWDGYSSPTPFDGYTYPQGGRWLTVLSVQASTGHWYQVWAWQQASKPGALLVFVFTDMAYYCDAQGQHCGNHHFKFYVVDTQLWKSKLGI